MKAIRHYGPGDFHLEDIPEPSIGRTQVKVKNAWCGICGTDLHTYHGSAFESPPTLTVPHPLTNETLPVVVGHEFSGTIVELGPDVDTNKYHVGQHVAVEPFLTCKKPDCFPCALPETRNLCPRFGCLGVSGGGGGLSEYVAVDQELAHILPDHIPLEVGALVEPLAVVWRALKKANVKQSDRVLILGAGPIGIFAIRVAKAFGASWVGVSGRGTKRCELALQHGASVVYNLSGGDADVVGGVTEATNGRGADATIDCAGTQDTIDTALKATRPGGTIVNVASWQKVPSVDMNVMLTKELTLTNSFVYAASDFPDVIKALADGRIGDLEDVITLRVSLDEFVEKGLGALLHEKDQHVKVLAHP
ncbi:L-threonine 3-dehydrogenase [Trametes elegans]|nr:L-threonine 3-dehydrogenase [Trametes elegans]